MIEHLFSHWLARKTERRLDGWLGRGRAPDAIRSGDGGWSLSFGLRHRVRAAVTSAVLGSACLLAAWVDLAIEPLGFWLRLAYAGVIFTAFALSAYLAIRDGTTRITLSDEGLVVRRFGRDSEPLLWPEVRRVYRSASTPSIVIETHAGRRLRVSTELSGLRTLRAFLARLDPGVLDRSMVNWVIADL